MRNGHVVRALCSIIWVVGSNIAVGLCVMDMWSMLCVLYVGGGI